MRKIFTIFAAMLLVLTASAKTWNITDAKSDTLKNTIGAAASGDTIVMAAGTYTASSSIGVDDSLVIMAADKNNMPLVKAKFGIQGGKRVEFHNLKFDASLAKSSHLIYANDSTPGNQLVLEGCEFSGDTANSALIHCSKSELLDSCIINNCYFHEIKKSCFFNENVDVPIGVKVTNSTFANISTVKGSYYAGVIDTRATSGKVRVDHCTFYNCFTMNTDYAVIGKIGTKDAIVSNCIFSLSSAGTSDYRTIRDKVTAKNCLVYNYTTDSNYGMQSDVTKENCIKEKDPLFVDVTKGFQVKGDWTTGQISPARGAATDGTCLGDPRWYTDENLPDADLTAPYFLDGSKAQTLGTVSYNETDSLKYTENKPADNKVTWRINALNGGRIQAKINYVQINPSSSGNKFNLVIFDSEGNQVGDSLKMARQDGHTDLFLTGSILLPSAGAYTIKLTNEIAWSGNKIRGVTLSLVERPTVKAKGSAWNSWADIIDFDLADDGLSASYTTSMWEAGNYDFKMLIGGTADSNLRANGYYYYRNGPTGKGGITANGNDMRIVADYYGEYKITWFFETDSVAITYPEKTLEDGYYLVGTFGGVNEWGLEAMSAAKMFIQNPSNDKEYTLNTTVAEGDELKVRNIVNGNFQYYYPDGSNYVVDNAHAGNVTIYFRPDGKGGEGWHYGNIYVEKIPTSIDNTVVGEKAVKFFENGQLFIQKDGKTYNILGTIVK